MKTLADFDYSHPQRIVTLAVVVFLILASSALAVSAREKVIYSFGTSPDGAQPSAGLVADKAGNLYGTTLLGGNGTPCGCGTVFELSPPATEGAAWTETVLHNFSSPPSQDGSQPSGALIFDKAGNLYGTTIGGGSTNHGTVYELSPPSTPGGTWTETVLHSFGGGAEDEAFPRCGLVFDKKGNLYGVGYGGYDEGQRSFGTVFELSPPTAPGGAWTETVIYKFQGRTEDGGNPLANLVFDSAGNLYGTTPYGGSGTSCVSGHYNGCGTVFALAPPATPGGPWTESVIHNFGVVVEDGSTPLEFGLLVDKSGALYGTTYSGGGERCKGGCGVVFKLTPPTESSGEWTESILYTFTPGKDGGNLRAPVVFDKAGDLYSTASLSGLTNTVTRDNGTMFQLMPPAVSGGAWTETTLHEFGGSPYNDGGVPSGPLVLFKGRFYGTTSQGGSQNLGTVFTLVVVP